MFSPIGQIPLPDCHLNYTLFACRFKNKCAKKRITEIFSTLYNRAPGNLTIFCQTPGKGILPRGISKTFTHYYTQKRRNCNLSMEKIPGLAKLHPFPPIKENGTGAPQSPGPESVTCGRQRLISGKLTPCNRERMQNSLQQNVRLCVALCSL